MPLAGHGLRPTPLRRRVSRPQLKRDPLGGNAEDTVKVLDRVLGWLLVVGGLLHALGSWTAYRNAPPELLWALSGSLAALLLAALNLLRAGRPQDRRVLCAGLRVNRDSAFRAGFLLRLVRAEAVSLVREEGRMHGADVGGAGAVSDGLKRRRQHHPRRDAPA